MKKVRTASGPRFGGRLERGTSGAFLAGLLLAAASCSEPPRREPPPIASAVKPGACADAASAPRDPIAKALLPLRTSGMCLDPQGGDKAYGEDSDRPIERACDELLDGECEIYRSFGASRVLEARYVDDAGSPATLVVHLSKFNTAEGAYAMFTLRVVGDGDPAGEAAMRPLDGPVLGALGVNNAYVVRGPYLAEIVFTDETAGSAAALRAAAEPRVVTLAKEIGAKLSGDTAPPPAAAVLPSSSRVPLGVRYHTKDMFGIAGAGPGAVGYYRDGEKRYRVVALLRPDADQAKDLLATLARQPGASREKHEGVVRLVVQPAGELPAEWIFSRTRGVVLGVGDEIRVLQGTMTSADRGRLSLSLAEKKDKLKEMLAAVAER